MSARGGSRVDHRLPARRRLGGLSTSHLLTPTFWLKPAVVLLGETHDDMEHHRWQLSLWLVCALMGQTWWSDSRRSTASPAGAGPMEPENCRRPRSWTPRNGDGVNDATLYLPLFDFVRHRHPCSHLTWNVLWYRSRAEG